MQRDEWNTGWRRGFGAVVLAAAIVWGEGRAFAVVTFEQMALEFTEGLGYLKGSVPAAIGEDGTVVFAGSAPNTFADSLFIRAAPANTLVKYTLPSPRKLPQSLQTQAGRVVYVADGGSGRLGVYRLRTDGTGGATIYSSSTVSARPYVSVAPNQTLVYSTLANGTGAIMKGTVTGRAAVFRSGTNIFYNHLGLDVNELGQVAAQMEYSDPSRGLSRGILVIDTAEEELANTTTAIERTAVSVQPRPSINSLGEVAFALNSAVTVTFGAQQFTYAAGVYKVTPTAFGQYRQATPIATTAKYSSFGKVEINDDGLVVFEATPVGGSFGVFYGADPATSKVIAIGDTRGGRLFSWVSMGGLNNSGQVAISTSDYYSTDRQVWRVTIAP
ncbi:MAG: hypothetical protein SF187_17520 [Deltaproteobacteria bacterium]|nr:hypothetical protein [Deltaproteobacteria bacterium]